MTGMPLSEKLAIVAIVVAIVVGLLQLTSEEKRLIRLIGKLALASVMVWLVIILVRPASDNRTPTDTPGTTDTSQTTSTIKTVTYPAPPEKGDTSTTSATAPVTNTTSSVARIITATTNTDRPPIVEPQPPTPLPNTPSDTAGGVQSNPILRPTFDQAVKQALALNEGHEWREAAEAWERLIRINAGRNLKFERGAYHHLGLAYFALNDWDKAAGAFKQANWKEDLHSLGRCYMKLGRNADARAVYQTLVEINPDDTAASELLKALNRQR